MDKKMDPIMSHPDYTMANDCMVFQRSHICSTFVLEEVQCYRLFNMSGSNKSWQYCTGCQSSINFDKTPPKHREGLVSRSLMETFFFRFKPRTFQMHRTSLKPLSNRNTFFISSTLTSTNAGKCNIFLNSLTHSHKEKALIFEKQTFHICGNHRDLYPVHDLVGFSRREKTSCHGFGYHSCNI